VSRFLTAHQHNWLYIGDIHVGSRWKIQDRRQLKNTDDKETKHNQEKANNTKHSKTKLPYRLQHSARKRGGLILYNAPEPNTGRVEIGPMGTDWGYRQSTLRNWVIMRPRLPLYGKYKKPCCPKDTTRCSVVFSNERLNYLLLLESVPDGYKSSLVERPYFRQFWRYFIAHKTKNKL